MFSFYLLFKKERSFGDVMLSKTEDKLIGYIWEHRGSNGTAAMHNSYLAKY